MPDVGARDAGAGVGVIHIYGRGVVGRRAEALLPSSEVLAHSGNYRQGGIAGDVAVLAHGGPQLEQAVAFIERGLHVVAVGDGVADVRALLGCARAAEAANVSLVIGSATSPGLAGLLARFEAQHFATVDEIHVAVHGTAGPDCAVSHHESMRGWTEGWRDGRWVPFLAGGGRELCWFPEPIGGKDCYRSRSIEPTLLHETFPSVQRISHRRSARRRDRLTAGFPMLSAPPPEGGVGGLRVELRGAAADGARITRVAGMAERIGVASAAVAVAFANLIVAGRIEPGLQIPGVASLPTLGLLTEIERLGVRLQVFTGVPEPAETVPSIR